MQTNISLIRWTDHAALRSWIEEAVSQCRPANVHLCEGTAEEAAQIADQMVKAHTLVPLAKRPGSYWCHSHPDDVARVEECTFICSKRKEDAGPTNNWKDSLEMKAHLKTLFNGCMQGRTMYVIPYCMGPLGSPMSRVGVEISDSPYVVLNMRIMTRMGRQALDQLKNGTFIPGLHSVGVPLKEGEKDVSWPCNPKQRIIAHFPEERSIFSFGSGYGGNALLGKKCFALRIASVMAKEERWMAEHMLILGITNPQGEKKYMAAAFPSACGKTNLAMMQPELPGWKVECVGDDIAWMHIGKDGRLYAINPESGYFGVASGTSMRTNPMALLTVSKNALFTNTALTDDGDIWWEGMTKEPPPHLTSWLGEPWDPASKKPAAHPNSRFTVPMTQCPIFDPAANDPQGVPISAILFGGRRSKTMPLVIEALSWNHGVFLGASLSSETTAAAKGEVGKLRHDPFAMLPFCGYNMGDYFAHWIEMGQKTTSDKLPRIYSVNWFRKDEQGSYVWPGFTQNARVLKWIFERCNNEDSSASTPIGQIPTPKGLDLSGIKTEYDALFSIDRDEWKKETQELETYFHLFGNHFPRELASELHNLEKRLS